MNKNLIILGIAVLLLATGLSGCVEEEIKNTDMSVLEIKNSALTVSYDDLMRNIDNHKGKIVYFRGGVIQIQEVYGDEYNLRVATKDISYIGYYEDILWVNYKGVRLLENDIIDVWGYVKGLKTYMAVLGNEVTIPELDIFHVELVEEDKVLPEELEDVYEREYENSSISVNKKITKGNFEVTVIKVGHFDKYEWGVTNRYFRIDIEVKNIGTKGEYFMPDRLAIIDDQNNQYEQNYLGTLDTIFTVYPDVTKKGYYLFEDLSESVTIITFVFELGYDENFDPYLFKYDINIK